MYGTCTYQVGNWLHIHNIVHDQVIQSPRSGNNDFYSLGHNIDLLPSVASTIHTNTVINKRPIDDIASLRCTSWLTNAFIIPAIMNVLIIPATWFHFLPLKIRNESSFEQTWIPITQRFLVPSLVEIVTHKKKIIYFDHSTIISPWKKAWSFIWINLTSLHKKMLCLKFSWI